MREKNPAAVAMGHLGGAENKRRLLAAGGEAGLRAHFERIGNMGGAINTARKEFVGGLRERLAAFHSGALPAEALVRWIDGEMEKLG